MEESGGLMLMGEFNHTIDNKNRLIIPSKLRSELEGATITRGLDKCLAIYPKNEWDKIVNKLATLPLLRVMLEMLIDLFLVEHLLLCLIRWVVLIYLLI